MKKALYVLSAILILAVLLAGVTVPISAESIQSGTWGTLTWELNVTTGHLTIWGTGEMIGFNYYTSTEAWLLYNTAIRTVTIEEGITSIGERAFYECYYLTDIKLPNSITSIQKNAFYYCYSLENIKIPNAVVSIGENAFFYCDSLTEIEIPNSVTSINNYAFFECNGLTSIQIPNSVTFIGNTAFGTCDRLANLSVDTDNPKYHANGNCIIDTQSKTLVAGCKNSVIPSDGTVTTIGNSAFSYCSRLTDIKIPNGVTSIEDYAFYDCGITNIELSKSVISIGNDSFTNCCDLINIKVENENPKYHASGNCIIETQSKTLVVGGNNSIIPSDGSVTAIGNGAFSGRYNLTSIKLPNGITSIGSDAFANCCNLTGIEISNGVISVGDYAFSGCNALSDLKIPNSVRTIGDNAFAFCHGLTNVVIPNGVVSVGNWAFWGCSGLKSVKLPSGIAAIGVRAFSDCNSLTSIEIPGSVSSIGNYAFAGCSRLTKIIYCGTATQWNSIKKGTNWNSNTGNYTIQYHNWGDEKITREPTCAEGEKTFTCSICQKTKSESIDNIADHIYDSETDDACNNCGAFRKIDEHTTVSDTDQISTDAMQKSGLKTIVDNLLQTIDLKSAVEKVRQTVGCRSTVSAGVGLIWLLTLGGAGVLMKKKKN